MPENITGLCSLNIAPGANAFHWTTPLSIDPATGLAGGVGTKTLTNRADRQTASPMYVATRRGNVAAAGMSAIGIPDPATPASRDLFILQETAPAGVSAFANLDHDVAELGTDATNLGNVLAGASIFFAAGVPGFVFSAEAGTLQRRFAAGIVDAGAPGDITVSTEPARGIDPLQSVWLACMRGVLAPSQLYTLAVDHIAVGPNADPSIDHQITIVQEGAGGLASVRADLAFDLVVLGTPAPMRAAGPVGARQGLSLPAFKVVGGALIDFGGAGGAPQYTGSFGCFDELVAPVRTGGAPAGDVTLALRTGFEQDPAQRLVIVQPAVELAPNGLVAVACDDASESLLRVTQLAAAGVGGSVPTDVPFRMFVCAMRGGGLV